MVPAEALKISNAIRQQVTDERRIGVTELARGTTWRNKLADCKILEVIDRGSTAGWLLSKDGMASLLDTITYFEEEAERTQVAYLVEKRTSYDNWETESDLHRSIDEQAERELANLRVAFDAN